MGFNENEWETCRLQVEPVAVGNGVFRIDSKYSQTKLKISEAEILIRQSIYRSNTCLRSITLTRINKTERNSQSSRKLSTVREAHKRRRSFFNIVTIIVLKCTRYILTILQQYIVTSTFLIYTVYYNQLLIILKYYTVKY